MSSRVAGPPGGGVVAGNVYDKYGTKNPVERYLVGRFMDTVLRLAGSAAPATVLEVGCGEGRVADALRRAIPGSRVYGCDISADIVAGAGAEYPEVGFFRASAYEIPAPSASFDLVVACEVLEHLDEPERALDEIRRVMRGGALVSVPCEPLWRAMNMMRGKYIGSLGNTPGHVKHWSRAGIIRLLTKYFDVAEASSPLPWTVCLCMKRRP